MDSSQSLKIASKSTAILYKTNPELRLRCCNASTTAFSHSCSAFNSRFFRLPVVNARAVFAEHEVLALADNILMLSCQCDMASAASPVFDRDDHAVFFIAEQSFVNLEHFNICIFCNPVAFCL